MILAELLLEIGTEEIPSGYLDEGLKAFKGLAQKCLEDNRIRLEGNLETHGTPRRLVLVGRGISKTQEDLIQEITGPPLQVAYDDAGKPTQAALGFARKMGVSVEELGSIQTPKGEYVHIRRQVPGQATDVLLKERLPEVIAAIPWPKSMRWGDVGFSFVRPIHWVLCLFDGKVIPFEMAGLTSGRTTRGHRFMAPEPIEVTGVADYVEKMRPAWVVIDPDEREMRVEEMVREAAQTVGGSPADDPELRKTVTHLVEYPCAVCGSFDHAFLSLPDEVLITAMKEHQKYFAVYDHDGKLMPHFVAVNNTVPREASVVQRGHERVLRARLTDADFFYKEDRKRPLLDRLEDLKRVIYQTELGTSHDKVARFTRLSEYLASTLLPEKVDEVRQIARLCKCDLVTLMVSEFPSLQGVMGKAYAEAEGYPEEIASGIYEHYLPTRAGGSLPGSGTAAVVSIADRMDTIAGCFAVGLEPTGSADPFALRRHALAIIRIIEGMKWSLSLTQFIDKALDLLSEGISFDKESIRLKVITFMRERYKNMMLSSGYGSDLTEAVISAGFDDIRPLRAKLDQLKAFSEASDQFHGLALTVKRVKNILKNQKRLFRVDPNLFREPSELALWKTFQTLRQDIRHVLEQEAFSEALSLMVQFKAPVDTFFDQVEVLTQESRPLQENRVGMLQQISRLMDRMADFSQFSI
ncbi:MAG: glycine--tRNA ligase subunit beta [Deltaproteobacteria bacterium]|nr:glycine--tRNA ligase subunit beta [Deltaproteobacteria bacterium]